MPKSKRNQTFNLTKTEKKGRVGKDSLYTQIQSCSEKYTHIYLFKVENMRNSFMKQVRTEFKDDKFFYGSNRVMAKALGTNDQDEATKNSFLIAKELNGNVGLFFSNQDEKTVLKFFETFTEQDFARGGGVATDEFVIKQGPLMRHGLNLPNNMEPMLRKLGLPTELKQGVLVCREDYVVCKPDQVLTPDQAHLLKHFGVQMAFFKISIGCMLAKGEFKQF